LPLVGGSGGSVGASNGDATSCRGGGGGGGGGAILVAANGDIKIDGTLTANGGSAGYSGVACASSGGNGSGGAIRIVGNNIMGNGTVQAVGGLGFGAFAGVGSVRMEAFTNAFGVNQTNPQASRTLAPGPLVNPFEPTIAITAVAGQPVSATPQGVFGVTDVTIAVPGPTRIDLATNGVPMGTTIAIAMKPRVGGTALQASATLVNCAPDGKCLADTTINLAAGSYVVEARATYQPPTP